MNNFIYKMSKELLISNITTMINDSKDNIRKKQLLKNIDSIYDSVYNIKKKPLNQYNEFMKTQMKKLKDDNSSLSNKDKMSHIAGLWKLEKEKINE